MRKALFIHLLLFISISYTLSAQPCRRASVRVTDPPACIDGEWTLVFEDEFDGTQLDKKKWHTQFSYGCRCTNDKEPQSYMDKNVSVRDGILTLTYKKQAAECSCERKTFRKNYTSGIVCSKENFLYGLFEAEIKIPNGTDFFPAFWLWGGGGEIDIFEFKDDESKPMFTVHRNNPKHGFCPVVVESNTDYSAGYHKYAMHWDPYFIAFYIDDVLQYTHWRYQTYLNSDNVDCVSVRPRMYRESLSFPEDRKERILINLGGQNNTTPGPLPAEMKVKYVRVWQKR